MPTEYGVRNAALKDTLTRFGLVKTAEGPNMASRIGNALFRQHPIEGWGSFGKEFLREGVFGSPLTLYDRLKELHQTTGSLPKALARHTKDYYWHPQSEGIGKWMNGLNLAASGYDLYSAVANGPENRFGDLAAGVTGLALNPITGHLGLAGIPVHVAVQNAARTLGHKLDPSIEPAPRPYAQRLAPAPHVRRVLRSMNAPALPPGMDSVEFG